MLHSIALRKCKANMHVFLYKLFNINTTFFNKLKKR